MAKKAFEKATKENINLRAAFAGPSGSGKTYQALMLARGLLGPEGKIAVLDTENGSSKLFSNEFHFDVAIMEPPYEVKRYLTVIEMAKDEGYDCLIIDSISHAWAGEGGVLDKKSALDSQGGNSFTNWAQITPMHNALVNAILHPKYHLICTLRSKQEWVLEPNAKGKQVPRKVGMGYVQRDGLEYEFDIVFNLSMNHKATASKDRTGLFSSEFPFEITKKTGPQLKRWLSGETEEDEKPASKKKSKPTTPEHVDEKKMWTYKNVYDMARAKGWPAYQIKDTFKKEIKPGGSIEQLPPSKYELAWVAIFSCQEPDYIAVSPAQVVRLNTMASKHQVDDIELHEVANEIFGIHSFNDMGVEFYSKFTDIIQRGKYPHARDFPLRHIDKLDSQP